MNEYFSFYNNKLKLKNGPGAYKITEDALWLLSVIPLDKEKYLEVGCATGVISLLLKLKNEKADIKAIDLQEDMINQAKIHAEINNIKGIDFINTDLYDYNTDEKYDCVFSNPPFFEESKCCKIADKTKEIAYLQCDIIKFIIKMLSLVKNDGFLCFLGHKSIRDKILTLLKDNCNLTELEIVSKENKEAKRFVYVLKKDSMCKFSKSKIEAFEEKIRKKILFDCDSIDLKY